VFLLQTVSTISHNKSTHALFLALCLNKFSVLQMGSHGDDLKLTDEDCPSDFGVL